MAGTVAPQAISDQYPTYEDLVAAVKDEKRKFDRQYGAWRKEARENYDMVAGDGRQWDVEAKNELDSEGRPCVEFNWIGRIIDAVSGSENNNQQEVNYIPRVVGSVQSQGIGTLRTAAAKWVRDNCDAAEEESDSFLDVLISGVGATLTRMDYEQDEEGQIIIERKDPMRLGWDAAARKRNLADAKCVWEEKPFTRDEIEQRWPDKVDSIQFNEDADDDDESEPRIVDPQLSYKKDDVQSQMAGMVNVTHYQWYETISIYKVLDPMSQQMMELPEDRAQLVMMLYPGIPNAKVPRRVYYEAFVCGEVVLEAGQLCQGTKHPAKDFTFQFITGKRDRNPGYWYGLVRPGKDPQRWANKFFSQILHIINTNAKGGVLAETGAVQNVKKFEADWAKSDAINWLNPGGLSKIQQKQPAQVSPALSNLMQFSFSGVQDTMGVNLEMLGLADREQAGVLENQRTRASLTILAPFFSSLRLYRKKQGRVLAYFIDEYISDGRLIRVAGPDGEQFIPLIRQGDDVDFDTVVDAAPVARDTKLQTWQALMPVLQMMQQQGIIPPPEVLDYLPIPITLAQKIKQAVMTQLQQRQGPNPAQQADLRKTNAMAEQAESTAALNYAKSGQAGFDMAAQVYQALSGQPLIPPPMQPQQPMQPQMPQAPGPQTLQ